MSKILQKLNQIQQELKAPKNQFNSFGNYNYRSCEDILEAVKPLLDGFIVKLDDEMVAVGERNYVKAIASLISPENESVVATAYAREPLTKKGMDEAQITGSTSSYARKYALNGLFLIDDQKDADTMANGKIAPRKKSNPSKTIQATKKQQKMMGDLIADKYLDKTLVAKILGKEVSKFSDLTAKEASDLITEGLMIKNQSEGK